MKTGNKRTNKKILIIGPFPLPINGCSYANQVLTDNLKKRGIDISTINTSTPVLSSKQGGTFSLKKAISFFRTYFLIFNVFKAEVVYFTPGQTFFGMLKYAPFILICIFQRKPYFIHVHGNYLGTQYKLLTGLKRKLFGYLISRAQGGFVLSKSLRGNFEGILPEEKVHVVENFAEDALYHFAKGKAKDFSKLKVLYFSNLMKEKGIFDVLEALKLMNQKGIHFEATLAGAIEKDIETEVHLKIEDIGPKVKYIGVIKGEVKNAVLLENNVFILPTFYPMEGQPISIIEAMAMGNIIVTTQHGGIPDIVSSKNGYFVNRNSPNSIFETLIQIDSLPLENKVEMSNFNSQYAKANFTEGKFTQKIVDVLIK